MKLKILYLLLLSPCLLFAQGNTNFTQFFINPYLFNPSYAGTDAQTALFLSYRMQWTGFDGSPTVANLGFHTPAGQKLGLGLNVFNEERSVLNTNTALLSLSYSLPLGENNFLRFGMSAGGASSSVDLNEFENISDPEFAGILESNIYLVGNAGVSLQIKTFNVGIASPNIFSRNYTSEEKFGMGEVAPLEQLIISASNRFYFSTGSHVFEPSLLYRYSNVLPSQLEVAGVVHLNHLVWFGGSYKQDFGISAFGGLKVKQKLGIGYSYSLANSGINEINAPTHEIHLSFLLGGKNKDRLAYSFLHTEKEKKKRPKRPTVAQKEPVKPPVEEKPAPEDLSTPFDLENGGQLVERQNENGQIERGVKFERTNEKGEKEIVISWLPSVPEGAEGETFAIADPSAPPLERTGPNGRKQYGVTWTRTVDGKTENITIWSDVLTTEEVDQLALHNPSEAMHRENSVIIIEGEKIIHEEEPIVENQEPSAPEKPVVVKRGGHLLELEPGEYVIVGAFGVYDNAERYSDQLFANGYPTRFGYISEKKLWYVYLFHSDDIKQARIERDKVRKNNLFPKAWVLSVEK